MPKFTDLNVNLIQKHILTEIPRVTFDHVSGHGGPARWTHEINERNTLQISSNIGRRGKSRGALWCLEKLLEETGGKLSVIRTGRIKEGSREQKTECSFTAFLKSRTSGTETKTQSTRSLQTITLGQEWVWEGIQGPGIFLTGPLPPPEPSKLFASGIMNSEKHWSCLRALIYLPEL